MDIIIHGKPLAGSSCVTSGIDSSLAQKIVQEFFEAMSGMKEKESLVVDARYWKDSWYSVYTYFLAKNIKDTAGRESYFALSLIIPQKYCCLVSQVYSLLQTIVKESVVGVYLSQNGQYIVQDLSDTAKFKRLCDNLMGKYVNLEEKFDAGFKPSSLLSNDTYCNLLDCDSKALVNLLKTKGRIIVTESAATKDSLAQQASAYARQVQQLQAEVNTNKTTIEAQNKQILQLQEVARKASDSQAGQVKQLEMKVSNLQAENAKLTNNKSSLQTSYDTLVTKVKQLAEGLKMPGGLPPNPPTSHRKRNYLPALNTFLIVLLSLLVSAFLFKDCSGNGKIKEDEQADLVVDGVPLQKLQNEVADLQNKLSEKDSALLIKNNELNDANERISTLESALSVQIQGARNVLNQGPSRRRETARSENQTAQQQVGKIGTSGTSSESTQTNIESITQQENTTP